LFAEEAMIYHRSYHEGESMSAIRIVLLTMLALAASWGGAGSASAQAYPSKPIHIVVPFAPGGITDILARALGQQLTDSLGQQVVIENKPGANSQIGAEAVAKAAPDGYTLLVSADTTFSMNPHLFPKLSYDPVRDFAPISGLGISPQALVVHPSVPVKNLSELIDYAKKHPGEINYGTFGPGSSGHLNIVLLETLTGAKFTAVHYKGANPAITDVLGGHIQMIIVSIGLVRKHFEAGTLKLIGFGSAERLAQFPDVPTIAESLPGYEAGSWYGLVAPKGTPREIVDKLSAETQKIFGDPAFRDRFLAPAMTFSIASSPEKFSQRIDADFAKWGRVIKAAKVQME
jgi:tripartite-type tricarboxylate transporter receptor subunit TctC